MPCLAATIYRLWRERNFRIFQHEGMDTNAVTKKVWEEVRACACSWRNLPRSTRKLELCSNWEIPVGVCQHCLIFAARKSFRWYFYWFCRAVLALLVVRCFLGCICSGLSPCFVGHVPGNRNCQKINAKSNEFFLCPSITCGLYSRMESRTNRNACCSTSNTSSNKMGPWNI